MTDLYNRSRTCIMEGLEASFTAQLRDMVLRQRSQEIGV